MNTLWKDIKLKILYSGSRLNWLIGINILVFLAINLPATFEQLFVHRESLIIKYANEYLAMPLGLPKLRTRFWTPLTHMFMHAGVFHILNNMIWLYFIGMIFEEFLGKKRILSLYLFGGLAGALFFVLAYQLIPLLSVGAVAGVYLLGASGAVMSIVIGTATLLPDYTIFVLFLGPIRLKWIALAFVIMDFLATPYGGGEIAHLGGALFGFIYIKQLQKGHDWSKPFEDLFKPRPKIKVVSKNTGHRTATNQPRQEEIDLILDKISQSGYDSLSKQEKETLFRASKNDR